MGLTYTKNGQGQIIKTFSETIESDKLAGEISALEIQLHNIKASALNGEGVQIREHTEQESSLITELEQALIILKE